MTAAEDNALTVSPDTRPMPSTYIVDPARPLPTFTT